MLKIRHKKPALKALTTKAVDSISASDAVMHETVKGEIANEVPAESLTTETMVAQVLEDIAQPEAAAENQVAAVALAAAKSKKPEPTVLVTVPFLLESKCYLDVTINEKKASLFKESLKNWTIEDGMVAIEMPRALARRRGLLQAA